MSTWHIFWWMPPHLWVTYHRGHSLEIVGGLIGRMREGGERWRWTCTSSSSLSSHQWLRCRVWCKLMTHETSNWTIKQNLIATVRMKQIKGLIEKCWLDKTSQEKEMTNCVNSYSRKPLFSRFRLSCLVWSWAFWNTKSVLYLSEGALMILEKLSG